MRTFTHFTSVPPRIYVSRNISPLRMNYFPRIKIPEPFEHALFCNILPLPTKPYLFKQTTNPQFFAFKDFSYKITLKPNLYILLCYSLLSEAV